MECMDGGHIVHTEKWILLKILTMATRRDYHSWLFQALYYTVYVVVCLGKIANFCSFHLKLGHICTIFNMECMEGCHIVLTEK